MPCAAATERVGLILAGGRTSAADWRWRHGISLLDHSRLILQRAGLDRIVASGAPDDTDGIPDLTPNLGPLGGLISVLRRCPDLNGCMLMVIPADMPALNPRSLARLAEVAEFHGRGARFDLGPLPLALICSQSLLDSATEIMADTGSLQKLVDRLELPVLASLPDDGLDNVDSHRELKVLRQRMDTMQEPPP